MQQLFKNSNHYHYKPSKNCSFKNNQFLHRTTRTRNFNIKLCMYNLIVVTGEIHSQTLALYGQNSIIVYMQCQGTIINWFPQRKIKNVLLIKVLVHTNRKKI